MKNLRQVYDEGRDVRDSDIPQEWKESWFQFIMGQTCTVETNENGEREFVYYSHDFRRWYHMNQKAIERDIKIDQIYE
jgi:hypothetical protein